jgi:hypothetical protein
MSRFTSVPLVLLPLILAACGASASGASPTPTVPAGKSPQYAMTVATSELAVGQGRFTFGVLKDDRPVEIPKVRTSFFVLHGKSAVLQESTTAKFNYFTRGLKDTPQNSAAFQIGGVYVAYPKFSHVGTWGVQANVPVGGKIVHLRSSFLVQPRLTIPAVGTPAPRSHNPTTAQEPATRLDSGRPPDDMHKLSIAAAIAQHKPLVVLFATAAFCQSRLCGPEIEVVQGVENRFRGRVNFVHIEVYKNAIFKDGFAPTFLQWHLQTEPWIFVVDRHGIVRAEFEGATPASEIDPALERVLKG